MSFEKGDAANTAEKEASEVLHSLLSVDRRDMDSKENIIVSIPNMDGESNQDFAHGDHVQWHTPVLEQQSVYISHTGEVIQHEDFDQQGQQVIWQGHTIQIENSANPIAGGTVLHELYPAETLDIRTKVEPGTLNKKSPAKTVSRKRKKPSPQNVEENNESDERNKLEDNPLQVKLRMKKGCDCKDSCYRGLIPENVYKHRLNIAELTKSEHDMYLMGVTMACLANPLETTRRKARRRLRASYVYQGRRVCLEAFLYLENVTHYQLKRIRHHVMTHGVAPRVHGNIGKKPYNTFSLDIYKHATEFLKQYLDQHAGGCKDLSKTIFVQGDTRRVLFDAYKEYGEILEPGIKLMGYSTFRHFMKEQFPNVRFATKKLDLTKDMPPVPFKSGKCMTYDKNKDPVRMEAEKAKAEAKKSAMEAKKKEKTQVVVQQNIQVSQQQQQQQQQHHQQQQQHHHQVVQQLQTVQVNQNPQVQQVQAIQQVSQHQLVQQMNVQAVTEESTSQQMEITQQVIPLTVVQQPQQTYIVTPVSHLQTSVHGTWYRH